MILFNALSFKRFLHIFMWKHFYATPNLRSWLWLRTVTI